MIRPATQTDIPRLVQMGRRFRSESSYATVLADNPAKMTELGAYLLAHDGLLVSESNGELTGMLGYVIYPHFISGEVTANETFWWVEPERRGDGVRLLREAERRAKNAGAEKMAMIAPNDRVADFYTRLGYEYVESAYQRVL